MTGNLLNTRIKLAILYSIKYSPAEASAKFLIPINILESYLKNENIVNELLSVNGKYNLITECIHRGFSLTEVSEALSWKDFEEIVTYILNEFNFKTFHHVILTKPKREVDVIALKGEYALIIDCKNWRVKLTESKIRRIIDEHINRSILASKKLTYLKDKKVVPLIVTLYPYRDIKVNNVYVIPITYLRDFLIHGYYMS